MIGKQIESDDIDAQKYINIGFDTLVSNALNKKLLDTFIQSDESLQELFHFYDERENNQLYHTFTKYIDHTTFTSLRFTSYLVAINFLVIGGLYS